ncbi:hypothetical protein SAMN05444722_2412 [Rhodovulum sp. ES.010]|uniref:hypothetical protein n=1 Tax=Rhodovulum sp. ES.010 TaxID=1882821 RepID=UPI000927B596|nr:hypothetical protein [Rhodovulum sp. ES.010]SIO47442.1 hypothetical protein SAMN05444722_2412 [Rhodovulum sp. ES.010]
MFFPPPYPPILLIAAVVLLAACWPFAQRWRHPDQRPLAAYLIFASVLALVSAPPFWLISVLAQLLLPGGVPTAGLTAVAVALVSLGAGVLAACRVVRRPPRRRMPR